MYPIPLCMQTQTNTGIALPRMRKGGMTRGVREVEELRWMADFWGSGNLGFKQ